MCFKSRFKSGGGLRIADFRWQGIPVVWTLVREAAVAKRLCSERRDRESACFSGRAEGSCRSVCMNERGKIERARVEQGRVGESGDLVLYASRDWEPVK